MLTVGLTGGIGSGKSTVANLFASYGTPLIDADVIAHEITTDSQPALKTIIEHFGDHLRLKNGGLDRSTLRTIIFNDTHERKWLEALLHPLIRDRIKQDIAKVSAPYCLVIIPLLFETSSYPFIDRILVVDTSEKNQFDRIARRDHADKSQITAILKSQATRVQRLQGANDIILNDGELADLIPQVERFHLLYRELGLTQTH
jgi:dephospho-CoA kinase